MTTTPSGEATKTRKIISLKCDECGKDFECPAFVEKLEKKLCSAACSKISSDKVSAEKEAKFLAEKKEMEEKRNLSVAAPLKVKVAEKEDKK
jgi:hypothetical protein